MRSRFVLCFLVWSFLAGVMPLAGIEVKVAPDPMPTNEGGIFIGSRACPQCHLQRYQLWLQGPHAGALISLPADKVRDPKCLRCHSTGYGYQGGYQPEEGFDDLKGVGCEACHGPGNHHVETGRETFTALINCPDCLRGRVCLKCHVLKIDPDFDLPAALKKISCAPLSEGRP